MSLNAEGNALIFLKTTLNNTLTESAAIITQFTDKDGNQKHSDKNLYELADEVILAVNDEVATANQITEAIIALIGTHDPMSDSQPLVFTLLNRYNDNIAQGNTAFETFWDILSVLRKNETALNIEPNGDSSIATAFDKLYLPTMTYFTSLCARQGIFLPDALNNEMRNGINFHLFTDFTEHLIQGEALCALLASYDQTLFEESYARFNQLLSDTQKQFLYHYMGMIAFQIAFGSLNAMKLTEKTTGLNLGFAQFGFNS